MDHHPRPPTPLGRFQPTPKSPQTYPTGRLHVAPRRLRVATGPPNRPNRRRPKAAKTPKSPMPGLPTPTGRQRRSDQRSRAARQPRPTIHPYCPPPYPGLLFRSVAVSSLIPWPSVGCHLAVDVSEPQKPPNCERSQVAVPPPLPPRRQLTLQLTLGLLPGCPGKKIEYTSIDDFM